MSHSRHILILVVIFITLLVISIAQFQRGPSEAALSRAGISLIAETPGEQRLFPWRIDEIQGMRLQRPTTNKILTLQRNQENEWITSDGILLTNQDVAMAAVAAIVSIEVRQEIPDVEPSRYTEFGLSPDELNLLVQIILDDGQVHSVAIGGLSPNRDSYYAIRNEETSILVLKREQGAIDFLIKSLDNTN